jgi:hypothetical protein
MGARQQSPGANVAPRIAFFNLIRLRDSTAFSVLGPAVLKLLPAGVEAMEISETDGRPRAPKGGRFDALLATSTLMALVPPQGQDG